MGRIISLENKVARRIAKTNKGLKFAGFIIVVINISLGFLIPFLLLKAIKPYNILYNIVNVYLIYTCIAARSLHYEAMKVYKALNLG